MKILFLLCPYILAAQMSMGIVGDVHQSNLQYQLISGWTTTDGSGSTITDQYAGHNFTMANGTWSGSLSPLTNSAVFNGSTTTANTGGTGSPFNFERTNSFSGSMWMKNTSASTTITEEVGILTRMDDANNYRGYRLEIVYLAAGGNGWKLHFSLVSVDPANAVSVYCNTNITTNTLHHVGWSYSGTSLGSGVILYIDGAACPSQTTDIDALSSTIQNSIPLQLGAYGNFNFGYFTGNLANVYIYNRVLTAGEFATLFSTPYAPGI